MSTDEAILESWSILKDYGYNRGELLAAARAVYRTLFFFEGEISPQGMEPFLIDALLVTSVFRIICVSKRHANPALYPVFAGALARYILQHEWDDIIR
jgi:hypothetical protein